MSNLVNFTRLDHSIYSNLSEYAPTQASILNNLDNITRELVDDIDSRYYAIQYKKVSFPSASELEKEYAAYCLVCNKIRDLRIEANRFDKRLRAGLIYLKVKPVVVIETDQLALHNKRKDLMRQTSELNHGYHAMRRSLHYFHLLLANGKPLNTCQLLSAFVCPQHFYLGEQAKKFKDREITLQGRIQEIEKRVTVKQVIPESLLEKENDRKDSKNVEKTASTVDNCAEEQLLNLVTQQQLGSQDRSKDKDL